MQKPGNTAVAQQTEQPIIQSKPALSASEAPPASPETTRISAQTNPQGKEKLSLGSVVQDIRRTMAALGTDDETQQAVEQYLNVTLLESQKETPSTGLMKGLLKSASDRLDGSISKTLEQPSRVVREWMDAVLLQDVNFKQIEASNTASRSSLNQASALMESAQNALSNGQPEIAESSWRKMIAVGEASLSSREAHEALSTFKNAAEVAKKLNQPEILKASLSGMVKAYIDLNHHGMALKVLQVADRLGTP
jgi:hypothetical protein